MLRLRAETDAWGCVAGGQVRCWVELHLPSEKGETGDNDDIWVDFIAAQFCGFATMVLESRDGSATTEESGNSCASSSTALPDESLVSDCNRRCIISSEPQVLAAGLQMQPCQKHR